MKNGTPAAKAGLRQANATQTVGVDSYPTGGDVITAIDGQKVSTSEELQRLVDAKRPGDTVSIEYWRDGKSHTVDLKLGTRPS